VRLKALAKEVWFRKDAYGTFRFELGVTFVGSAAGAVLLAITASEHDRFKAQLELEGPFETEVELVFGTFDKPVPSC